LPPSAAVRAGAGARHPPRTEDTRSANPAGTVPLDQDMRERRKAPTSVADTAATVPGHPSGAWNTILGQLDLQGAARQLAGNCVLLGRQGAVVRLGLDPRTKLMRTPSLEDKLAHALSKYFGEPVRLEFESAAVGSVTPAAAEERSSQEELESARRALESDPGVQGLRERFGATLLPDSVRPLKSQE